jgi:hypothetical protein
MASSNFEEDRSWKGEGDWEGWTFEASTEAYTEDDGSAWTATEITASFNGVLSVSLDSYNGLYRCWEQGEGQTLISHREEEVLAWVQERTK